VKGILVPIISVKVRREAGGVTTTRRHRVGQFEGLTWLVKPSQFDSGSAAAEDCRERTRKTDRAGTFRLVSHIHPVAGNSVGMKSSLGDAIRRMRVERLAVEHVLQYEADRGRTPIEMPCNNPGYDIASVSEEGQRLIECKGLPNGWKQSLVSLTKTDFEMARKERDRWWLFVVEPSDGPENISLTVVQNVVPLIERYALHGGWRGLGVVE
jgi:hypothetical protein